MHSRPWLRILQSLPTPARWAGVEFAHFIHWLDRCAARAFNCMRNSPAFFFVSVVGTVGIGLTVLLFLSMIEQATHVQSKGELPHRAAVTSRAQLEDSHEWSTQDRWRVAHFFVPHRPPRKPKEIHLDSRLFKSTEGSSSHRNERRPFSSGDQYPTVRELDVRLELNRPKRAEQDRRLVAETMLTSDENRRQTIIRKRDPRLMVQAAWEFGPDCARGDYVSVPVRRSIPVPAPEPETVPLPQHHPRPDLGYVLELFRHVSTTAYFPLDSRLVSESRRTAFPDFEREFLSQASGEDDPYWRRHHPGAIIEHEQVASTEDHRLRHLLTQLSLTSDETDEVDDSLPSVTEVDLKMEWSAPQNDPQGEFRQTKLLVKNDSPSTLHNVKVLDLIAEDQRELTSSPEGSLQELFDPESGATARVLSREKQSLRPGEWGEFYLQWIPGAGRQSFHRSRVVAQAAVFAATEVISPQQPIVEEPEEIEEKRSGLACDVQYFDRAFVGDKVEFEITVRNTGETPLHQVKVRIEIPEQLSHPDGKTIVFDAGDLDVHGQNQTILKLSAHQVGDAINSLAVAAAEKVEIRGNTRMQIVDRVKEPTSLPPLPETIPTRAKLIPLPATQKSSDQCCCQRSPTLPTSPVESRP